MGGEALSQRTGAYVPRECTDNALEIESWALVKLFKAATNINDLEQ